MTIAQVFFSSHLNLGRVLLLSAAIFAPRSAAFGLVGLMAVELAGSMLSRNGKLRRDGLFSLNGWFLGLSCACFLPSNTVAVIATLSLAAVCAMLVIMIERILRAWDLPPMVMPYVIAIWFLQVLGRFNPSLAFVVDLSPSTPLGQAVFDQTVLGDTAIAQWLTGHLPLSTIAMIASGSIKGYGQIFSQDNVALSCAMFVGLALFSSLSLRVLILIPVVSTLISFLVAGPNWALDSGLCSFAGILIWAAFKAKTLTPQFGQLLVLIAIAGPVELVSLKVFGSFGLFSLSFSYVALVWAGKLGEETQSTTKVEAKAVMPW